MAIVRALLAFVVFVLALLAPALAFAQDPGAPEPSGVLAFVSAWPTWLQALIGILLGIVALTKAIAIALGLIGGFAPKVMPAAAWFANASTEVHNLAARLTGLVPGSVASKARMAARRAAKVVPPLAGMLLCGWLVSGCAWFQAHPAVAADLQKVEDCVEPILAADEAAGDTPLTIGIDLGSKCGSLAVQVVNDAASKAAAKRPNVKSKAALLLRAAR